MSSVPHRELKEMLASGWKVVGFQQITNTTDTDGIYPTVTETGGYAILLQRDSDLAICDVRFDSIETVVAAVHFLTSLDK